MAVKKRSAPIGRLLVRGMEDLKGGGIFGGVADGAGVPLASSQKIDGREQGSKR